MGRQSVKKGKAELERSMTTLLKDEFAKNKQPSRAGEVFLTRLEDNCAQDLWQSAGGNWSSDSIAKFRALAMHKLASALKGDFLFWNYT